MYNILLSSHNTLGKFNVKEIVILQILFQTKVINLIHVVKGEIVIYISDSMPGTYIFKKFWKLNFKFIIIIKIVFTSNEIAAFVIHRNNGVEPFPYYIFILYKKKWFIKKHL